MCREVIKKRSGKKNLANTTISLSCGRKNIFMKKLYTLVILALFSTASYAQTSDLQLLHTFGKGSFGATHYMNNVDTIIVNPTTVMVYTFGYVFVNHGPSALIASDTIHLRSFATGNRRLTLPTTGFPVGAMDTLYFTDTASYQTGVTQGNYNWCDSLYATHVNGSLVNDPILTNNKICNTVYARVFNISVPEVTLSTGNLSIYPNPATSNVNFNYDFSGAAKASLIVTDIVGRTVYQEELIGLSAKKTVTVNVNGFVPGMYIATLVVDDTRITGKFTVQK
jgi:hypothetical protein